MNTENLQSTSIAWVGEFDLTIDTEDGTVLLEKSYGAGEEIDLVMPEYNDEGPEPAVEEDVPKKA